MDFQMAKFIQQIEEKTPLLNQTLQSICCSNNKKRAPDALVMSMSRQPSQLPSYIKGVLRCQLLPTEQVWYYAMLVQEAWYVLSMLFITETNAYAA